MTDNEQKIILVGGAPRSGTTVTHALLCTSDRTNPYHPEISYVTPLLNAYKTGLINWDAHTSAFFKEKEHFRLHFANLLTQAMTHISRVFADPEILCVKDPLLTPYFPAAIEILRERLKLVSVVRHPYAIVRSRQEVARKSGLDFDLHTAVTVCQEYNQSYQHLDDPALQDVLMHFRYEDILDEDVLERLRSFTQCPDISTETVWGEEPGTAAEEAAEKDPWFSPKYHQPINIDNRLDDLDLAFKKVTDEQCGALMERFDYEREATDSGA